MPSNGKKAPHPKCVVIAGPNGAGKTIFAREFLPTDRGIVHFVNADLIASGLSPLQPELAARFAARLVLNELSRLAKAGDSFAFESTLSGRSYLTRFRQWREQGYGIEIVFLRLNSVQLAQKRIAMRVLQGGHNVPRVDVIRRFKRGKVNFENLYKPLADHWALYDNSGASPVLIEKSK